MKKKLILLILVSGFLGLTFGQSIFYPHGAKYTSDKDEWFIDAATLNNNELVLLGANINDAQKLQELILQKINLGGEVSLERKLPLSPDSIYRFCNIFHRNGQLEVFGFAGKLREIINSRQYHNVLCRYVFDMGLNFLYKETIVIPIGIDYTIMYARFKINKEGNIYGGSQLFMEPSQVPINPLGNFYFVLNRDNLINSYSLDSSQRPFFSDLVGFEIHQISPVKYIGAQGVREREGLFLHHNYNRYSANLERTAQFEVFPDLFSSYYSLAGPYFNLLHLPDTESFILAGTGGLFDSASPFLNTFFVSQSKIDSTVEFVPNLKVIRTSKVCYFAQRGLKNNMSNTQVPAYFQCIDRNTEGEYVFGGMLNHRMDEYTLSNDLVADTLCFAVINENLTLKLQKTFFNNEQITLHKIMYLPDGSIMAIGFARDYIKNPSNITRDYFALKLNSNGDPVTGFSSYNLPEKKVSIYPNPALTSVNITCEFIPKEYLLLNSLGKVIKKDKPSYNSFSIDLSTLESGTYFLQIFNQNGSSTISKLVH